ncbi:MAG: orotidine-5'-phosphate decarboxylase [Candidatus Neomarinimicrobiota bacterium]
MTYLDSLRKTAEKTANIVCIGLDPVMDFIPEGLAPSVEKIIPTFFESLFQEMRNRHLKPAAFKPNQGYYLIHDNPLDGDFSGSKALAETIKLCRQYFPDIPIIMDYKRGDIASSSANYANEGFIHWAADAVTISPYMGSDSVIPFLEYAKEGQGTYILNRTSNKGGKDFQNLILENKQSLYQAVGQKIVEWSKDYPGTGAVVGATNLNELKDLAKHYAHAEVPLLIPGVGSQGGSATEVMSALQECNYDLKLARINSSSGITHPWKKSAHIPDNWCEVSIDALEKLITNCKI